MDNRSERKIISRFPKNKARDFIISIGEWDSTNYIYCRVTKPGEGEEVPADAPWLCVRPEVCRRLVTELEKAIEIAER